MDRRFILDAVRTPRGRGKAGKGALSGIHPQELLAQALNRLAKGTGDRPARDVDDVIVGCVSQVGEQGANIARNAVLAAGWPYGGQPGDRQPLLRLGPAGGQLRAPWASGSARRTSWSPAASRACRACRWAPTAAASTATTCTCASASSRCRRASAPTSSPRSRASRARTSTPSRCVAAQRRRAPSRRAASRSALFPVADPATGALAPRRRTSSRAPDTTAEGLAALEPAFVALGATAVGPNGETLDQHRARALPAGQARSTTCTPPATRAASSTAPPPCCSPRERYVEGARAQAARAHPRDGHHRQPSRCIMLTAPAPASREGAALAGMNAERHRPLGDQRGLRRRGAPDHPQRSASTPRGSTSTAARSRSATRSARPARCCSAPRSTSSSGPARHRAHHAVHRRRAGHRHHHRKSLKRR